MRKGRDGEKKTGGRKEKTDENSGHYVIASSRPPEHRPLEHRTPINTMEIKVSKYLLRFVVSI